MASARRWTYRELAADVNAAALGMLELGLRKGDRLGIWAPNRAEWTITHPGRGPAHGAHLVLAEADGLARPGDQEDVVAGRRLDDADALVALLADRPRGLVPPLLRAELARARALIAWVRDEPDGVEPGLRSAIDELAALGYPFWLARAQTDLAAWFTERGRSSEAASLVDEATGTLEQLGAAPALARARGVLAAEAEPATP